MQVFPMQWQYNNPTIRNPCRSLSARVGFTYCTWIPTNGASYYLVLAPSLQTTNIWRIMVQFRPAAERGQYDPPVVEDISAENGR